MILGLIGFMVGVMTCANAAAPETHSPFDPRLESVEHLTTRN